MSNAPLATDLTVSNAPLATEKLPPSADSIEEFEVFRQVRAYIQNQQQRAALRGTLQDASPDGNKQSVVRMPKELRSSISSNIQKLQQLDSIKMEAPVVPAAVQHYNGVSHGRTQDVVIQEEPLKRRGSSGAARTNETELQPDNTPDIEQGRKLKLAPTMTYRVPASAVRHAENPGFARKVLIYHAMFLVCFTAAMGGLIAAIAGALDVDDTPRAVGIITTSILVGCVGIRNEIILNILYLTIVHSLPHILPRIIRVLAARFLYNVGGIHSGCGVAVTVWMVYYIATIIDAGDINVVVLATAVILFLQLTVMILLALPRVRERHHNLFELSHRYMGWSAVLTLWLHVMAVFDVQMWQEPVFYLTIAITVLVFLPWMFVRNVGVQCVVPFKNAIIINDFPGAPLAGTFGRVSTSPLLEWHTFATITTGARTPISNRKTHCMAIAAAGDWTKQLIANPPTRMWVRQIRTPGFMYTTRMFSRIVCMATGAGIAPILPLVVQKSTNIFVLWVAREPQKFYGQEVYDWVTENGQCWIHDTAVEGHPNSIVELALRAVRKHDAEALFIVSNPGLTYKVVRGCNEIGVPAFGAIWDS